MTVLAVLAPAQSDAATTQQPADSQAPPASGQDDWTIDYVIDPKSWSQNFSRISIPIPRDKARLAIKLDQGLQSAYAADGWSGIDRFIVGVFGLDDYSAVVRRQTRWRFGAETLHGDKLIASLRGSVSDDRRDLWTAFEGIYAGLKTRIATMLGRLTGTAQQRLIHVVLPQARSDTLRETRRYLSLAADTDEAARQLLVHGDPHAELLLGPEGEALRTVLLMLKPLVAATQNAEKQVAALAWRKTAAGSAAQVVFPELLGIFAGFAANLAADSELATAARQLAQAKTALDQILLAYGAGYPILYRLVDTTTDVGDEVSAAIALTADLQDAWQASLQAATTFKGDADLVWTLPMLIEQTIRFGFDPRKDAATGLVADPDRPQGGDRFDGEAAFAERVAADKLTAVNGQMSTLDFINGFLQVVDVSTTLIQPEFPVLQLAVLLATIATGVADLVKEYIDTEPQRLTSRAAIDQSHSISSASPYLSLIVKTLLKSILLLPAGGSTPKTAAAP